MSNRVLSATLYTYVEPINGRRAKVKGAEWGSFSNYVNYLIARDHGDAESMKRSKKIAEEHLTPSSVRKPKAAKKTAPKKAKRKAGKKKSATAAPKKADLKARALSTVKSIVAKAKSQKSAPRQKTATNTKASKHA